MRSKILSFLALATFATVLQAQTQPTVAYEIRRNTVDDVGTSELLTITTQRHYLDATSTSPDEDFYYFIRAAAGTLHDIRVFGNSIPAQVFVPASSSDGVEDLVYYTQNSTFSGTFFLLDDDAPDPAELVWPEDESLRSETLTLPAGNSPRLIVRFVLQKRIYQADADGTAELVAYDPFSESAIATLGSIGQSSVVTWEPTLTLDDTVDGVSLSWSAFDVAASNSSWAKARIFPVTIRSSFGTVSAQPLKSRYVTGDTLNLIATPRPGYAFANWSGTGSSNPDTSSLALTLTGPTVLTANYALDMPSAYTDWLAAIAPGVTALGRIGPDQDLDGDALPNYLEYILATDEPGSNPQLADYTVNATPASTQLLLTVAPTEMRGRLIVETSSDISQWQSTDILFQNGTWALQSPSDTGLTLTATPSSIRADAWDLTVTQANDATRSAFIRIAAPLPTD